MNRWCAIAALAWIALASPARAQERLDYGMPPRPRAGAALDISGQIAREWLAAAPSLPVIRSSSGVPEPGVVTTCTVFSATLGLAWLRRRKRKK